MKRFFLIITLLCTLAAQAQTYWDGTADKNFPGEGTEANPYLISTPEQLAGLAVRTNVDKEDFAGKYVKLTADIYLTDFSNPDQDSWKEWEPIAHSLMQWGEDVDYGYFRGHFDGAGHTIYNMYYGKGMNWAADFDPDDLDIDIGDYDFSVMNKALFGNLDGGAIENLTLRNAKMSGVSQALLVHSAAEGSVIRNCHVQGELRATSSSSSGLVHYNDGLIENCSANIRSDLQNCSGLVGTNEASGVVRNCSTGGFIRVTKGNGAGFVDTNRGLIEGCLANVKILALGGKDDNINQTFRYRSGSGFVHMNSGTIRECGATGDVDGESSSIDYVWRSAISGFAYRNWESYDRAGRIESCYATGNLRDVSDSTNVGGEPEFASFCYDNGENAQHNTDAAYRGDILNCYTTSSIRHHDADRYRSSIHAFLASKHTLDGGFDADLVEPSVQFACFFSRDGMPSIPNKAETGWDGIAKSLEEIKSQAFVDTLNMVASLLGTSQWELRDGLPRPTGTRIENSTVLLGGGSGTKDDPYLIATKTHLENLRWLVNYGHDFRNKYFLQTADIALNAPRDQWEFEAPARWEPIGLPYEYEFYSLKAPRMFRGIYDGGFCEVQNMYINSIPSGNYGLFGTLSKCIQLRNLGVTEAYIRADGNVGILAGSVGGNSVVAQCWTSGDISWKTQYGATVGGIVGSGGKECLFLNNSSSATVKGGIGGNTIQPNSGAAKGNYNVWESDSLVNFLFTGNLSAGERGLYGAGFEYFANMFVDKEKAKINYQSDGRYGTTMPTAWMQSKELVNIYNYSVSQWNATHGEDLQLNYWEWREGTYPRISNNKSWRPDVRITFNSNGGETVAEKYIYSGSEALPPQRPLREGYIFAGWYKDPGLTQFFCWETERPTSSLTLYARWHEDKRFEIDTTPFENEFATKIHIKTAAQLRGFAAIVNGVYDWGEMVPYSSEDPRPAHQKYPNSTIIVPDKLEGKTVVLDNDILLCDTTDWQYWGRGAFGLPWKAIGEATDVGNEGTPSFKGTFDGQGHVIYGMYIELNGMPGWRSYAYHNVGLFGDVTDATAIKNVGVAASVIDGQNYNTRGQAGDAVLYWRRQGYPSQEWDYVGMLAGKITGETTVSQCFTQGNMYLETSYRKAGFAGSAGNISNCYSRVNIQVNNYNESYVPEDYGFVAEDGSITNSYSAGQTYHAFCAGSDITGCYYDKTQVKVPGSKATPATPNAMRAKATFKDWDFENVWGSNDAINDGYPYLRVFMEGVPDTPDPVLVSGISLNVSDTTIIAGKSLQLIATVLPEEAENKKVIWSSKRTSNNYVSDKWFSFDENGLVTTDVDLEYNYGGGSGEYIITATTDEGNYEATCTLKVVQPRIEDIRPIAYRRIGDSEWIYKEYLSIATENFEYIVVAYTTPDEANEGVSWKTSDPERLSIEEMTDTVCTFYTYGYGERNHKCGRALVRCHKAIEGDNLIKIEASLASGINRVYDACVRVVECTRIKGIYKYPLQLWSESPDTEMKIGAQQLLTVELDENISYLPTIKWTSSDPSVLSVDENGLVTAVGVGSATIKASILNTDISATTEEITVRPIEASGIVINEYKGDFIVLHEGDTYQLTATISPENTTDKTVTWISSNEKFATVDENGLVRALKGLPVGDNYVTITAVTSNDRRADAEFSIKVDVLPEKVELDKHELLLKTGESYRLSAWVSPYNTTDKTLTWLSGDDAIATVSAEGEITALEAGTTEIIVRVGPEGAYKYDTCKLTVVPAQVTVSFYDWDGTLLQQSQVPYGEMPQYTGEEPTRTSTAQFDYVFAGWDPEIVKAEADASYTATYSGTIRKYAISFYDWDGTLLQQSEVEYGEMPKYAGEEPKRKSTVQFEYAFTGWNPALVKVEGEASYTAAYSEITRKYTISFYNWDGTLLQQSDVEYGQMPEYEGEEPTKESNIRYDYVFKGWNPELVEVKGKASYKATYSPTLRKYTISFYNWDGTLLQESQVEYDKMPEYTGPVPTRESISEDYDFVFIGWDPKIVKVTGDAEYVAEYKEVESETGVIYINGIRYTQVVKYMDKKGNVFIVTPDGRKYNLNGKKLK